MKNNKISNGWITCKKGFTLIELLAVIVILAIIALIVVPMVLNIINNTKEASIKRGAELYMSAVNNAIVDYQLNHPSEKIDDCIINDNGKLLCNNIEINVDIEGTKPSNVTLLFENNKIKSYILEQEEYCISNDGEKDNFYKKNEYNCSYIKPIPNDESDFTYTETSDTVTITNYSGSRKDVVIPRTINGKIVKVINSGFRRKGITSIVFPEGIETLGVEVFEGDKLKEVTLPTSIKSIGTGAFASNLIERINFPKNTNISIDGRSFSNNKLLGNDAFIYKHTKSGIDYSELVCYAGNKKEIDIPNKMNGEQLKTIGSGAFMARNLSSVSIPEGVEVINGSTFRMNKLTSIEFPSTLKRIGQESFQGNQLASIIIPSNVTIIYLSAFAGNSLENVTIKNTQGNVTLYSNAFGSFDTNNIVWQP